MLKRILLAHILLLYACTDRPALRDTQTLLPGLNLPTSGQATFTARWWEVYKSSALNQFVEIALAQNLTLQQARAVTQQAYAEAQAYYIEQYPNIEATYSDEKTHSASGTDREKAITLIPQYTLDLWGTQYAQYQSYKNKTYVAELEAKSAAMTIISKVVKTWVNIQYNIKTSKLLQAQLDAYKNLYALQITQFQQGHKTDQSMLDSQIEVERLEARITEKSMRRDILHYELAYLLGRFKQTPIVVQEAVLPTIPSIPTKGLTADLLTDRPDIQAAWFDLISVDWDLVYAKRDRLPKLTLSLDFTSSALETLLNSWNSLETLIDASDLFDMGRTHYDVLQQKSIVLEYVAAYKAAVLKALLDVKSNMANNKQVEKLLAVYKKQYDHAEKIYEISLQETLHGSRTTSDIIYEWIALKQYALNALVVENDVNMQRIELYNALGGNIWESGI